MSYLKIETALQQLVVLLKEQCLWTNISPSEQVMASTAPFSCDVMPFENWLQYIFIPKMTTIVNNQLPLPKSMAIAPMAEHVWLNNDALLPIIRHLTDLDILINE